MQFATRVRAQRRESIVLWLTLVHIHSELWVSDSLKGYERWIAILTSLLLLSRLAFGVRKRAPDNQRNQQIKMSVLADLSYENLHILNTRI